ncbi:unnamed protein product [Polarella glacialis]|uniref:Protochlorophyllide reductase n=1 Tax=Polarella glacialis TaxID=89957 RepID=A0A813GTK6_POLGL|nr:unnamed protein product [Polarella glacialis]
MASVKGRFYASHFLSRRRFGKATVIAAAAGAAAAVSSFLPCQQAWFGLFGGKAAAELRVPAPELIGSALRGDGPPPGKRSSAWEVLDVSQLPGRTALVTGANSGIGYHTAMALAYGGARVLLACRDKERGEKAKLEMQAALKEAGRANPDFEVVQLDLASLSSVRDFANSFKAQGRPLHLLCLNAGVMAIPAYTTSADGFEMQFATNHLGHFALTRALMDTLVASAPARVVTLASEAHRAPDKALSLDLPPSAGDYSDWSAYQQSKLANVLFSSELSRRLKALKGGEGVTSNAVHPGVISTPLGRQQFLKGRALLGLLQDRSEVQGAATSVYCLTAQAMDGVTGGYFRDCSQGEPSTHAADTEAAKRLWEVSERLLAEKGFFS